VRKRIRPVISLTPLWLPTRFLPQKCHLQIGVVYIRPAAHTCMLLAAATAHLCI